MHSKLITEFEAISEISISLFVWKHVILHPKLYYSFKFTQSVVQINWLLSNVSEHKDFDT